MMASRLMVSASRTAVPEPVGIVFEGNCGSKEVRVVKLPGLA